MSVVKIGIMEIMLKNNGLSYKNILFLIFIIYFVRLPLFVFILEK